MRSYPLLGLFLVTRHAVSKTPSNPVILRPTATGISLLFLSLKHSSAVIEVRVTGVTGWPQCWEMILPLPASASQRRKLRERWICGTCPCCLRHMDRWRWEGKGSLQWAETCSACDHLRGVLNCRSQGPRTQAVLIQRVGGGTQVIAIWLGGRSNFEEHWLGPEGQDQNCVLTLKPG